MFRVDRFCGPSRSLASGLGAGLTSVDEQPLLAKSPTASDVVSEASVLPSQIPTFFICPLSKQIMKTPVTAECGHSFEDAAFQEHIKACLAAHEAPFSPVTLAEYASFKAPVNRGLKRSIEHWLANYHDLGDPGPVDTWLAYKAPRGGPYRQPVLIKGSTVDHHQLRSWISGRPLLPFFPKETLNAWELVVPDHNLRGLMLQYGVGDQLDPTPPYAEKVHIHSENTHAWLWGRQVLVGLGGGLSAAACAFASELAALVLCSSILPPQAALMASVGAASLCLPASACLCYESYRINASQQEERKQWLDRRRRQLDSRHAASPRDTSAPAGAAQEMVRTPSRQTLQNEPLHRD